MNEQMFKHEWVNGKKNQGIDLQYDQSVFFLSHSCGLGRLKWMSYYEGGACACQSVQKGWTAFYYWYCWGLRVPRETLSHSPPVDNFLMWVCVHAAFHNRSAPPLATSCEVSPLANSALFILHFFSRGAAEITRDLPSSFLSIIQWCFWATEG